MSCCECECEIPGRSLRDWNYCVLCGRPIPFLERKKIFKESEILIKPDGTILKVIKKEK